MKTAKSYILIAAALIIVCVAGITIGALSEKKDDIMVEPAAVKPAGLFKTATDKISYILGMQIGMDMKSKGIELDVKLLARGLEDALAGKEPLLNKAEQQAAMMEFQKKLRDKMQEKQLADAMKGTGKDTAWKLQLKKPEMMKFDSSKDYLWVLETNKGRIRVKLMPDVAPMHVTSTIFLTKKGFYDGIAFHRVIPGFMAQGGCPLGTGTGGPGYKYAGEFKPNIKHDKPYLLSMANAGPNTDGSQFFLTFKPTPWLDGKHTIFGEIVTGQDVMKKLEMAGSPNGKTKEKLLILKASIIEEEKK
jgi:peptidyl-prolyl cis-trans isomerase B (cyclophilin B)